MDFGNVFSMAFRYAARLDRILPFFFLYATGIIIILLSINNIIDLIKSLPIIKSVGFIAVLDYLLPLLIVFIVSIIIFSLISIYIESLITHNAGLYAKKKNKPISFGAGAVFRTSYLHVVLAALIIGIITFTVSNIIPFIGWIFSIILSWVFLVYMPVIVIDKKNFIEGLSVSYNIFKLQKLDTFIFWILLIIFSLIIGGLAVIPFGLSLLPLIGSLIANKSANISTIISLLNDNIIIIAVGALISAFFFSYVSVFTRSATAFFYMQAKKGRRK